MGQYARMMAAGSVLAVLFFVLSLSVGRFYVPFDQVVAILASNFIELPITWDASMYNVVMVIRLPRVLGDILVGVALAVSGTAYQGGLPQRSRLAGSARCLAGLERGRVPWDSRASDARRHGGRGIPRRHRGGDDDTHAAEARAEPLAHRARPLWHHCVGLYGGGDRSAEITSKRIVFILSHPMTLVIGRFC